MTAYIFRAALLCEECAIATQEECVRDGITRDADLSDVYPQGPYPDGGGEADSPQHCDQCGTFLYNDLTDYGEDYVRELLAEHQRTGRGNAAVLKEWSDFYGITLPEENDE